MQQQAAGMASDSKLASLGEQQKRRRRKWATKLARIEGKTSSEQKVANCGAVLLLSAVLILVSNPASETIIGSVECLASAGASSENGDQFVGAAPPSGSALSEQEVGAPETNPDELEELAAAEQQAAGGGGSDATWRQGEAADRIRAAMRRYVGLPLVLGGYRAPSLHRQQQQQQLTQQRRQTRSSAELSPSQDSLVSKWLESTLVDTDGFKRSDRLDSNQANNNQQQQDNANSNYNNGQAQQPQTQSGGQTSSLGPSGHKTIRNIQPVLMRLPPRFGKRSCC